MLALVGLLFIRYFTAIPRREVLKLRHCVSVYQPRKKSLFGWIQASFKLTLVNNISDV
jgi:hypothetical protein